MEIIRFETMKGGWFIGDFEPTSYKTDKFEVCYKKHHKGEKWDVHYHKLGTEINYLVDGVMVIQGKELISGDIFIIYPYEISDPKFITDCSIIVVKTVSCSNDKYKIKLL
jgi:hypothetical protein